MRNYGGQFLSPKYLCIFTLFCVFPSHSSECDGFFSKPTIKALLKSEPKVFLEDLIILGGALHKSENLDSLGPYSKELLKRFMGDFQTIEDARKAFQSIVSKSPEEVSTALKVKFNELGISQDAFMVHDATTKSKAKSFAGPETSKEAAFQKSEGPNAKMAREYGVEFLSLAVSPEQYKEMLATNGTFDGYFNLVYNKPWESKFLKEMIADGYPERILKPFIRHQPAAEILSTSHLFTAKTGYYADFASHGKIMLLVSPAVLDQMSFSIDRRKYGSDAGFQLLLQKAGFKSSNFDTSSSLEAHLKSRSEESGPKPFDDQLIISFQDGVPMGFIDAVLIPRGLVRDVKYTEEYPKDKVISSTIMESRDAVFLLNPENPDKVLWPFVTQLIDQTMPSGYQIKNTLSNEVSARKKKRIESLKSESNAQE